MGVRKGFSINIQDEDYKTVQKYTNALVINKSKFLASVLKEYLDNHLVDESKLTTSRTDCNDKNIKRDAKCDIYADENLLKKNDSILDKTGWSKATLIEFAIKEKFDVIKSMNLVYIEDRLKDINKTKFKTIRLNNSYFTLLKDFGRKNNCSVTKILTLALVMYFEEHSEESV